LGTQTPEPMYPLVRYPDYTLMRKDETLSNGIQFTSLFLVVGGAAFPTYEGEMGASSASPSIIPFEPMPSTPADGTLVRQTNIEQVNVIYGGHPFPIPDPQTLYNLGFDGSQVREIPSGGLKQLPWMPFDGTLLREQQGTPRFGGPRHTFPGPAGGGDPEVYLIDNQQLRHVTSTEAMEENCLPWRHVRTVPENTLAPLEPGPDL